MTTDARTHYTFQPKNASRIRRASRGHASGRTDSSLTINYYNHCDRAIALTERDGTVHVLQPASGSPTDEIVVCVVRLMTRETMERAMEFLRNDNLGDNVERDQWIRAYEAALYNKNNVMLEASVEYVLYHHDLVDAGGRCYMPDLDLLVEWQSERGAEHPFSKSQRNKAVMEAIAPGVSDQTFVLMIKAVDNSQHSNRTNRFINVGGDVYPVPVERDRNYPTGVHVVSKIPVQDEVRYSDTIHRTFTFEDADRVFNLQHTVEDAINGGPVEAIVKNAVERETAVKRLAEARLRTDQIEADTTLQELRNTGAIEKARQEYDIYTRRNLVEWAKTAVSIIGAAITVYGIWSKFKTSS